MELGNLIHDRLHMIALAEEFENALVSGVCAKQKAWHLVLVWKWSNVLWNNISNDSAFEQPVEYFVEVFRRSRFRIGLSSVTLNPSRRH
jgi:hypothetical protein